MAEGEGFEPPVRLSGGQPISSRPRYDHFGIPPQLKELLEQAFAFLPEDAAPDLDFVVRGKGVDVHARAEGASLCVETPEDDPFYPGFLDCAGAHEAGLLRNKKGAS